MDDLNLAEALASLTLRMKEQELANEYFLKLLAGVVNPDNPEHAYTHFQGLQRAYVARSPELSTMKSILETIDRAKGRA